MTPLTFGSLFAGIGGFDLGLERARMVCKWQVEIDDFCQKILAKHWPNVERFRDVKNVGKHNLQPVDVICGGFPCQPFSQAGKQRGQEDDRYLWPEMLRIIRELKPRWIIGENVAGFINMELENAFVDLETEGYQVEAFVLPANAVELYHRRNRIWIMAYPRSYGLEKAQQARNYKQKSNGANSVWARIKRCGNALPRRGNIKPPIYRIPNGLPNRVDRLRSLGNAVVPQIPEILGRCIVELEHQYEDCNNGRTGV